MNFSFIFFFYPFSLHLKENAFLDISDDSRGTHCVTSVRCIALLGEQGSSSALRYKLTISSQSGLKLPVHILSKDFFHSDLQMNSPKESGKRAPEGQHAP